MDDLIGHWPPGDDISGADRGNRGQNEINTIRQRPRGLNSKYLLSAATVPLPRGMAV